MKSIPKQNLFREFSISRCKWNTPQKHLNEWRTEMHKDYDRYIAACNYPGQLNENAVTENLALYLKALGIDKKIVRLPANWQLENFPSLNKYVNAVLNDFATRVNYKPAQAARGARDAQDARAAQDALGAQAARAARAAQDAL